MHIFFSGIGGAGLGPLALIAHQAGYRVSGSDQKDSQYIQYLKRHGVADIHIGQTVEQIESAHTRDPIDWFVYSSAVAIENPDAPELRYCHAKHIHTSKRDVLLNAILTDKKLKLLAVAGTHGKTTTTAMAVWLLKQLKIPVSYSVGAKLSFGEMGQFDPASQVFVYEADEFDRNFLAFQPFIALVTGVDWDHHDIYPTRGSYQAAFVQFIGQSGRTVIWQEDASKLQLTASQNRLTVVDKADSRIDQWMHLPGPVNRQDAWQVAIAVEALTGLPFGQLLARLDGFPGVSRRFEKLLPGLYSDYAHTPPKIRGTLATAREVLAEGQKLVVVYEGLHNTRQHFILEELRSIFDAASYLYIVPTYLAREDKTLELLTPEKLQHELSPLVRSKSSAAGLDAGLQKAIQGHLEAGDLVVCISAGGGGSLDEWLRKTFLETEDDPSSILTISHL